LISSTILNLFVVPAGYSLLLRPSTDAVPAPATRPANA
jgi:hypothetical protein